MRVCTPRMQSLLLELYVVQITVHYMLYDMCFPARKSETKASLDTGKSASQDLHCWYRVIEQ